MTNLNTTNPYFSPYPGIIGRYNEGRAIDSTNWEIDHIIPLSEGGSNNTNNRQYLCALCHRKKTEEERNRSNQIIHQDVDNN